jgi:dihydrofolate synthase/folylpolyglutamate synthase
VVELLGDVHRAYPVIHVAGTNGKTSTARMIETILRTLGLRTGLFTSPHLISLNERIQIDGEPISDENLVANWVDIKPYVEMVDAELEAKGELRLTFFEVLTILGFAAFADAPVDVAVVEAGMGGEWDSTNVADGVVAVFTPIALDHTERLGPDITTIARTKSGIIKPAAMVVSAPQEPEAEAVLREAAELTESIINILGSGGTSVVSEVAVGGQLTSIIGLAGTYDDLFVGLLGDHQAVNADTATTSWGHAVL